MDVPRPGTKAKRKTPLQAAVRSHPFLGTVERLTGLVALFRVTQLLRLVQVILQAPIINCHSIDPSLEKN